MASVEWINNLPYIRVQVAGQKYRRRIRGVTSKSGAANWLRKFQKATDRQKLILLGVLEELQPDKDSSCYTFSELVVAYFDHHRQLHQPKSLLNKRQRMNAHWLPLFGERLVDSITTREIEQWITMRLEAKKSKTTIHNDLKDLKAIINWGIREKLCTCDNPVPTLPKISTREFTIMDEDQAAKYLEACEPDYYLFAAAALLTGMRRGELLELKSSDIDLKRRMIRVRAEASHKNIHGRSVPIRPDLAEMLKDFAGFNLSLRVIQLRHNAARKAINMPKLRFHDLRHTFASLLIKEGFDVSTVSQILGHSSDRLTRRIYIHIYPEHARKVIEGNPIILPVTKIVSGLKSVQNQKIPANRKLASI